MELNAAARAAFNAMSEGITIIDTDGIIVFGNTAYRKFLEKEAGGDIGPIEGYRLRDLRPGARLPDVLEKGEPIRHLTRQEVKDFYFVNMYPIYEDGVLTGGLSVVTFLDDAYRTRDELEVVEAKSRRILQRINRANNARYTFDDIVAVSPAAIQTKALAQKIAVTDAPVLLASESGTGKELYAQAIHNASQRRSEVFVAINCANFNANMLESELFGYVEGAFTGAKKGGKMGLFEAANGGTLFLDEVSEMDIGLQAKLLRVLQERVVRPVGGLKEIPVDVRVISASNADLPQYIENGKFRRDLYYRLSTFQVKSLPLRERPEDISALTDALLTELSRKLKRPITIADETRRLLMGYSWPGNVRELKNVLEASVYLSDSSVILPSSLPDHIFRASTPEETAPLSQRVRAFEQAEI
ncbi:MAG: sigma 54-interacting transcriptional regulator, partial [Oscillospiraceae bacterium]|nr:sigma 54-interacting transcriptional regulator [Oscillospiraceae bacterium]